MSSFSLQVRMAFIEGALQRLLGTVTRRGFAIVGVEARQSRCGSGYEVTLDLSGERSTDNIKRQIAKLYEVQSVRSLTATDPIPLWKFAADGTGSTAEAIITAAGGR
jgi:acetolactate synthase regulatory subunit